MKKILFTAASLCALSAPAFAGGSEGSLGVGAESQISGLSGVSMAYDMGQFHLGGFLGFTDDGGVDDTDITLGGRFFYHLHSTAMSDFGIGGSFGIGMIGDRSEPADNNATLVYIEPSFQIRAFVTANVALSFTGGISIGTGDAEDQAFLGQTNAFAGVHYYFF